MRHFQILAGTQPSQQLLFPLPFQIAGQQRVKIFPPHLQHQGSAVFFSFRRFRSRFRPENFHGAFPGTDTVPRLQIPDGNSGFSGCPGQFSFALFSPHPFRKQQAIYGKLYLPLSHSLQKLQDPVDVILIRMGNKNSFYPADSLLLQIGKNPVLPYPVFTAASSVHQKTGFSCLQNQTVPLSHIQRGNGKLRRRPGKKQDPQQKQASCSRQSPAFFYFLSLSAKPEYQQCQPGAYRPDLPYLWLSADPQSSRQKPQGLHKFFRTCQKQCRQKQDCFSQRRQKQAQDTSCQPQHHDRPHHRKQQQVHPHSPQRDFIEPEGA